KDDPVLIELPKGHFKVTWETRSIPEVASGAPRELRSSPSYWHFATIALAGALLISVVWGTLSNRQLRHLLDVKKESEIWTPDLEQLWQPYLDTSRPLVLAFDDPTFAGFIGSAGVNALIHLHGINQWDKIASSPEVSALRKALPGNEVKPRFDYVHR